MENTRRQQLAADGLTAAAVLALGTVLVAAGHALAGRYAPGMGGQWLRMAPLLSPDGSLPSVEVLLGLLASVTGLAVVAWWTLSMALATAAAVLEAAGARTSSRLAGSFAPAFMRRLALAVVGLSLMAAPAHAAPALPDPAWTPSASQPVAEPAREGTAPPQAPKDETAPTGARARAAAPAATAASAATPAPVPRTAPAGALSPSQAPPQDLGAPTAAPTPLPQAAWTPPAPPASASVLVPANSRGTAPQSGPSVEVRPGDSLWSIVARQLGPGSSDLEIAEAWPAWYAANEGVIGSDPDLIRPGQLLIPPR
ncbi:LysM domain-containing protein [Sinomonas halotolerans]|uniref:LysM domain-containing protein n=1 Tax=Sinomonas halotolerans TaxID=1644133 RepID=A0ABU9WZ97_9MICC